MEIKAIDVSSNQGKPDWAKVSNAGIKVAMLRIHERHGQDSSFEHNYKGCKSNGILIGGYKYSYALTPAQAVDEAEAVIEVLNGRGLDFPVFYDLEWDQQRSLGKQAIENITVSFLTRMKKAGYKVGIYCNYDWYKNCLSNALKQYDCWIANYPKKELDNGTLQERLRVPVGVGWQYSERGKVSGISGNVDMDVFYTDYRTEQKGETKVSLTKEQIIQNVRNDAVDFAVKIANDNSHGYSQRIRSLYNINTPKSFDCSSLACTSYYYAFLKNGLTKQANYLKANCSYTGNMLKMQNAGFEIVARNQTAHTKMIKGDLELNTTHHVAMAIDKNNIVHARSSEGTTDTKDNSGNEIRTQPWYLYSRGWTHRLRFTGKGIDFSGLTNAAGSEPTNATATPTTTEGAGYMFEPKLVKLGSEGTSVLLLQEILIARGFKGKNGKALTLSRKADENTIYALKQYQKSRNGVLTVDGECGEKTWKDLIAI